MDAVGEATHAERRAAARGVPALDRVQRGRPISPALLCDASAAGISPKEEGSTFESPRPSRRPASRSSTSASPWARGSCSIGPTPSGLPATAGNGRQRLSPNDQRILDHLVSVGLSTTAEVSRALDIPARTVRSAMRRLVDAGMVESLGSDRNRAYRAV